MSHVRRVLRSDAHRFVIAAFSSAHAEPLADKMERRRFLKCLGIAPASIWTGPLRADARVRGGSAAFLHHDRSLAALRPAALGPAGVPQAWSVATVPTPSVAGRPVSQGLPSNCKHTRWAYRPGDGRWYICGGDYPNIWGYDSAVSTMWAFEPRSGVWEIVYPNHGYAGDVQAVNCDEVAWAYDTRRDVFWKVTGFQYRSLKTLHTWRGASTPLVQDICTFEHDPMLKRWRWRRIAGFGEWKVVGPDATRTEKALQTAWGTMKRGVYDPVTDSIWIGLGANLFRFDCQTITFRRFPFGGQFEPQAKFGGQGEAGTYAIDAKRRRIWITDPGLTDPRYTHGRIFTVDIRDPDAPTVSKLCDFPQSWREITPAGRSTWFLRQCYDSQLVYMETRGLLLLWGPSERSPGSIIVDVETGRVHEGPSLPKNAPGIVFRMAQYDAPRDRIICGWSPHGPREWGLMQDVYWIYTPVDPGGKTPRVSS